jgi:hypothetical protein
LHPLQLTARTRELPLALIHEDIIQTVLAEFVPASLVHLEIQLVPSKLYRRPRLDVALRARIDQLIVYLHHLGFAEQHELVLRNNTRSGALNCKFRNFWGGAGETVLS